MRAALYARVSTKGKGQTCDNQMIVLRDYAKARGFEAVTEFIDEGVSGAKSRRPALDKLWTEVRARKVDIVIVWKFDRFSRSVRDLVNALAEFKHLGINFVSTTEQLDTSSPMGAALFAIVGALAEMERGLIRERVACGLARARAMGVRLGRPRKEIDAGAILRSYEQTHSIRQTALAHRVSKSLIQRILAAVKPAVALAG